MPPESVQSRLGNLEGDMEGAQRSITDMKDDIKQLTNLVNENTTNITNLTNSVTGMLKAEADKREDWSKWEVMIVTAVLSVGSSVIVAVVTGLILR